MVPVIHAPAVEDVSRIVAIQVLQSLRTLRYASQMVGWEGARQDMLTTAWDVHQVLKKYTGTTIWPKTVARWPLRGTLEVASNVKSDANKLC